VRTLAAQGFAGVKVATADAFAYRLGPDYEVIAVTGSLPVYDTRFERALAVGGRLFVVVGSAPIMQARRVTRTGSDAWLSETLFETSIEPLVHAAPAPRFRF
jgi:protein-L-isoaspartate(D-aspartate) O-methyltransferase